MLRHEQGHFDITEIHARMLRKALSQLEDPCKDKKKIESLIDEQNNALQAEQKEYDDKTNHGLNADEQEEWEKKIKQRLKDLEKYK